MEITVTKAAGPFEMLGNCWDERKKELKWKHSQLTDADLSFETGKENELLSRIEARLNENRADGHHYIVYHCS
ncbi:MAG TPA: hypothetical protein VK808_02905 [Bacteroidia bacterium]|jgi:hypothetical protein|nr:hypothetical protein [Bacteroidia bacterium]